MVYQLRKLSRDVQQDLLTHGGTYNLHILGFQIEVFTSSSPTPAQHPKCKTLINHQTELVLFLELNNPVQGRKIAGSLVDALHYYETSVQGFPAAH